MRTAIAALAAILAVASNGDPTHSNRPDIQKQEQRGHTGMPDTDFLLSGLTNANTARDVVSRMLKLGRKYPLTAKRLSKYGVSADGADTGATYAMDGYYGIAYTDVQIFVTRGLCERRPEMNEHEFGHAVEGTCRFIDRLAVDDFERTENPKEFARIDALVNDKSAPAINETRALRYKCYERWAESFRRNWKSPVTAKGYAGRQMDFIDETLSRGLPTSPTDQANAVQLQLLREPLRCHNRHGVSPRERG